MRSESENFYRNFKSGLKRFLSRFDIALIALLAFGLRMVHFLTASYGVTGEVFRDMTIIYNFVFLHQWPLLGPSSSLGGFYFGAAYYYLLTPFVVMFNFAPYGATFASVFFSTLQVVVLYYLIRLWFNNRAWAALAALASAICLFDIQFAYYASNPNFLPFFIVCFFYLLTLAKQKKFAWPYALLLGLDIGIVTQLHATALLAVPAILILFLLIRKARIPLKSFFTGFMAIVFTYLPYLIYEFHHRLQNAKGIAHLGEASFGLSINFFSLQRLIEFWSNLFLVRVDFFNVYDIYGSAAIVLLGLTILLLFASYFGYKPAFKIYPAPSKIPRNSTTGMSNLKESSCGAEYSVGRCWIYWQEVANSDGALLIVLWLSVASFMFFFFQKRAQFFYFLVLWPLPAIVFSWFLVRLLAVSKKAFILVLVWFILLQAMQLSYFYGHISNKTLSHRNVQNLLQSIATRAQGEEFSIINNFFDPTTFHYYLLLNHLEQTQQRYNPGYIFLISPSDGSGNVTVNIQEYNKINQEQLNDLMLTEYQKNK